MTRLYTFAHHGDLGDTVASLPTIMSIGGGDLCLYPAPGKVREPYNPFKVERVRSFFESQQTIHRCYYADEPPPSDGSAITVVLDEWRKKPFRRRVNLADMVSATFRQTPWDRNRPWLKVNPSKVAEVVFHRSPRYRDASFPWQEVVNRLGDRAVFVGMPDEYKDFCKDFGQVRYYPTQTFLELAEVIAGAAFYVGNQSAPLWVRLGLCLPLYCESNSRHDNCHFNRANAFYGVREWIKVQSYLATI